MLSLYANPVSTLSQCVRACVRARARVCMRARARLCVHVRACGRAGVHVCARVCVRVRAVCKGVRVHGVCQGLARLTQQPLEHFDPAPP